MSKETGWINGAVEIVQTKKGGYMINVKKDLTLVKGQRIVLESFENNLNGLVERGIITENDANEKLAKLHFIKQVGSVAPLQKEESNF